MTDWSLPNNPGGLQNGITFPNDADDVLANDQALSVAGAAHEAATNGVHGVTTGAVVGTALTQTLTNKTLTSPVLDTATLNTPTLVGPRIASGGSVNDASGNEYVKVVAVASAVNEVTITNAATGNDPSIAATGGDANIDLNLLGKGTGRVQEGGRNLLRVDGFTSDVDTGAATLADNQATFVAADAVDGALTFTVNVIGRYLVFFTFNCRFAPNAGTETFGVSFRLNDGTNSSSPITFQRTNVGGSYSVPVTLLHVFNFATTGAKTVTLQYKTSTTDVATTTTYNDQTTFASECSMGAFRVAD